MEVSELDYALDPSLIAREPTPDRDGARLLHLQVPSGAFAHRQVCSLPDLLPEPTLIVLNDTRVLRARLLGAKHPSGGKVELLLVQRMRDDGEIREQDRWLALSKASRRLAVGQRLVFRGGGERLEADVEEVREAGQVVVSFSVANLLPSLERIGVLPIPPYMERQATRLDDTRYQTVYAKAPGAVAAPTAGLHFTEPLMRRLEAAGHRLCFVTLHVGPGTFAPVRTKSLDDHPMHSEWYQVPAATVRALRDAKQHGQRVLAVGTTVVRTLEASAKDVLSTSDDVTQDFKGTTDLLIKPPYCFRVVDDLLTNFHLPRSTLLALVMALGGVEPVRAAYRAAIEARYRFFSYGDAMLVTRDAG